eukprot:353928-Chlamydomonas_euryale.AAC.10
MHEKDNQSTAPQSVYLSRFITAHARRPTPRAHYARRPARHTHHACLPMPAHTMPLTPTNVQVELSPLRELALIPLAHPAHS